MLKSVVVFFILMRREEQSASAPAMRIAASPSKSSIVRRMKVSETEICPFTRGMRTTMREPKKSVRMRRRARRKLRNLGSKLKTVNSPEAIPRIITAQI